VRASGWDDAISHPRQELPKAFDHLAFEASVLLLFRLQGLSVSNQLFQ
jgi:hypothetical protein